MSGMEPKVSGKWVWAAMAAGGLTVLSAAAGIYGAFKGAEAQVASAKAELEGMKPRLDANIGLALDIRRQADTISAEIFALRAGMQYAGHIYLRQGFIAAQAAQAGGDYVLLAGDSITEGLHLPSVAGLPTVNGGMGGASMADALSLLRIIPRNSPVKLVVIEAGVNDAKSSCSCPDFAGKWESALRLAVDEALDLSPGAVAINTIIPLEPGKPLSASFDPEKIAVYNESIRKVAADRKIILIDNDPVFAPLAAGKGGYTSDGVHPNAHGYELWRETIRGALARAGFGSVKP